MNNNISVFKCYFKLITWNNGTESCYAYSTTRSYKCSFNLGGETKSSSISVRFPNQKETNKDAPQITQWLQDDDTRQPHPQEIAMMYKQEFGEQAYFIYDSENMSFELINQAKFDTLSAEQQASLDSPLTYLTA